jgi:hypothetical protein
VATREAIQRWRSVLEDIVQYSALPSGQNVRRQLASPDARANVGTVNSSPIYGMVRGTLTTPFLDLQSVDTPRDPVLLAILQPISDGVLHMTSFKELLPQWEEFDRLAQAALSALDDVDLFEPTVDELVAEMLLSLKTTLLLAGTGLHGSMKVIAEELVRRQLSFAQTFTLPLRFFDLATNSMVDHPSKTTLSLAGLKPIVDANTGDSLASAGSSPAPPVMKQFAAQAIVDFYTDWEEYYRSELARAHECDADDFQIDYFGDLSKLRQDYVHNRGVCRNSAACKRLKWFTKGQLMTPTGDNYLQLLTDFPSGELATRPESVESGRTQVKGRVDLAIRREFDQVAGALHGNDAALDEALAEWTVKNKPAEA